MNKHNNNKKMKNPKFLLTKNKKPKKAKLVKKKCKNI